jgi:hypothetical protein
VSRQLSLGQEEQLIQMYFKELLAQLDLLGLLAL